MKFEIIEKDWCKRRAPTKNTITPLSVSIPEYVQEHNYFCDMFVTYSDGSVVKLISRVIQNVKTKQWTVDGMKVAVRVIDN